MERTKLNTSHYKYSSEEEPIVISKLTMDLCLKSDNPVNLFGLYSFYYYTAKWQKTNQAKATTEYTAFALKWSKDKVRTYKEQLKQLGLIEDIQTKDKHNKIIGHYIKLNFIWKDSHPHGKPDAGESLTLAFLDPNALRTNNKNALKTGIFGRRCVPLTYSLFDQFWKEYPRKQNKGKALTIWLTLCNKKQEKDKPDWYDIRKAIQEQKKSKQWQNPKLIPHPATWLNQRRWLDDLSQDIDYSIVKENKSSLTIGSFTEEDKAQKYKYTEI